VQFVTGDTKVVDRGKGDGIFINTPASMSSNPSWQFAGERQTRDVIL